jgi:hypothetical protein
MATHIFPSHFRPIDRRRFLITGMGTLAAAGALASVDETQAAGPAVVSIGPRQRSSSDIEAWNVGLITACRRELTPTENTARNAELLAEIRGRNFGLLHLRGPLC